MRFKPTKVQMPERLNRLEQDYRDAKNHIYGLAHNVCVNGKEQHALLNALKDLEIDALKDGADGEDIIRRMLSLIYDGLAFGNWPWSPIEVEE